MTSEALVRWLASGERGYSSDTIVQHLTGIKTGDGRWGGQKSGERVGNSAKKPAKTR